MSSDEISKPSFRSRYMRAKTGGGSLASKSRYCGHRNFSKFIPPVHQRLSFSLKLKSTVGRNIINNKEPLVRGHRFGEQRAFSTDNKAFILSIEPGLSVTEGLYKLRAGYGSYLLKTEYRRLKAVLRKYRRR